MLSSARSSVTCSTSWDLRHRPSSTRGRPSTSLPISSCASTTISPGPASCSRTLATLRRATKESPHSPGLRRAGRDDSVGGAPWLLPHQVGAPDAQPQRVLRPPRGRTTSQRSCCADQPGPVGRGALAEPDRARWFLARRLRGVGLELHWTGTTRTVLARRRTLSPPGRDSGRAAALPLRPTGRSPCRADRSRRRRGGGAPRAVRHVRERTSGQARQAECQSAAAPLASAR